MPDIKKEIEKYKTLAKTKIPPEDQIHITRSTEGHTVSDDGDEADQEDEDENKRKNKDINNVLKSSKR
jgi:hypothetical protein